MQDTHKTKKQLLHEISILRTKVSRLNEVEKKYQKAEEQLQNSNEEIEETSIGLEKTLERSNYMAIESELTYLELNKMFNAAGDGMWIVNKKNEVLRINEALSNILSIDLNKMKGKKCSELLSHDVCGSSDCLLKQIRKGRNRVEMDIEKDNKDGTRSYFSLTANPFKGLADELIGIVVNFKDITKRKLADEELQRANKKLEALASMDGLTQIANRRSFDETLDRELKRQKRSQAPLSLIMCDIDYFKLYNDNYGHQLGDDCLQSVAKAFAGSMQRPADLAARYGGEEFVAVLPETDEAGVIKVADKIQASIKELKAPHEKSKVCEYVTLSIGVAALIPTQETTPEEIIKAADDALYQSKKSGRNCITTSSKEK